MSLTKLGLRDFKQPKVFVTPKTFFKKEGKWDTLLASTPVDGCDVKEKPLRATSLLTEERYAFLNGFHLYHDR